MTGVGWIGVVAVAAWAALAGADSTSPESSEHGPVRLAPDARLREALARRYDCDLRARVRLVLHGRGGGTRLRTLETATKRRGGRTHALGRVVQPDHLRGMAILTIEAPDRPDDTFVYLPSLARSRRVAGPRFDAPFLGSDLTLADLERHRASDYRVLREEADRTAGEPATRLVARPIGRGRAGRFQRVDFVVADLDLAILGVEYRGTDGALRRRVTAPRRAIRAFGRHRIPTRIEAEDLRRGTRTEAVVTALEFDPPLDDRLFSVVALESGRPIGTGREAPAPVEHRSATGGTDTGPLPAGAPPPR